MNHTPRNDEMLRTRRPEVEEAPSRTVDEAKADWPMAGFQFRFDNRTSLLVLLTAAILVLSLILSLVLLISGRETYFNFPSTPSTEARMRAAHSSSSPSQGCSAKIRRRWGASIWISKAMLESMP